MIDLHMHTTYSDGTESVEEVLKRCEEKKLEIISITDHDTCGAYYELENNKIRSLFKGEILTGVEITTSFDKQRIELLAYNFKNYKKIHEYLKEANDIDLKQVYEDARKRLLGIFDGLGLKYADKFKTDLYMDKYEFYLYLSVQENNKNVKEVMKDEYCERTSAFFRKCISNPNSIFFLNYSQYRPDISDIINIIHEDGGILFLAHPFSYGIDNVEKFINELYDNYDIDGIEVYHSFASKENIMYLTNFANERNLLISGGSDYHGISRPHIKLGELYSSDYYIVKEIIDDWKCIND